MMRPSAYLELPAEADVILAPEIARALGAGRGCDAAILEGDE